MNSLQNRSTLLDKQYDTGQFSACIVTNIGKEMIAKSQNGQTLTFTRVALGDGLIDDDDDILSFTKVKNERLSANIAKWVDKQNGQFQIQFRVSNQEVEIGFWQREIGIMAKIDGGEEQLYAYATSGNGADFLYDKTTPIDERIVNIDFVIGNAENVQVIVNGSIIYATIEDLENAIDEHNADENAHDNLIKRLFGSAEATLDSIKLKIKEWAKEVCLPLSGGPMKGNINANGYNITATKFIGNLQGKANSATNADLATKANQDSQGQVINTTYIKGITASNATLTVTKGNGTISTVTINNVGNSTKATQDSQGQAINTTYIKSITASNATLTVTKGNGTTSTVTINNVAHSTSADSAIEAGNINKGFQVNEEDFHISDFRQTILGRANNGICARPFCGKLPNNTSVSSPGIAFGGIDTHGFIQMEYGTSNIYVGAGNANKINWYKRLAITDSPAFSGTPTAPTPGVDTNNTQLATCEFVRNAIAKYAPMLDTLKKVYPVGSIYMSTVSTNPATLFGFGTWEAMPAGRVLLAQGKSSWGITYNAGSTGGEATHQLTVGELPSHNHTASTNTTGAHTHTYTWRNTQGWAGSKSATSVWENTATNNTGSSGNHSHTVTINNTGNSNAHNNIPPYLAIYMWKRTA